MFDMCYLQFGWLRLTELGYQHLENYTSYLV